MNVSQPGNVPTTIDIPQPGQVLKDPCCLYPHIRKVEGCGVFDSLLYPIYALDARIRDHLISAPLRSKLKIRHMIAAFSFTPPALGVSDHDCRVQMKKACDINNPQQTPDKTLTWALADDSDQTLISHESGYHYQLNTSEKVRNGDLLAIYNHSNDQVVTLKQEEQKFPLKAHAGLILKAQIDAKGQCQWQPVSKYTPLTKQVETNPLIVDVNESSNDKSVQSPAVKGEMLLPPNIVRDLVNSVKKPGVCTGPAEIQERFHQLNAMDGTCSVIVFSETSNHMVALRGIAHGDDVYLYINETLDTDCPIAQVVRLEILQAAQSAFRGRNLHVLTPGFRTQSDFSCCSLFTLEAVNDFENKQELDQWLISQCQNENTRVWQCSDNTGRVSRRRNEQKQLPVTLPEGCYLDVEQLPARLLKLSQNNRLKFTLEQLATVVGNHPETNAELTLDEYIKFHSREITVEGSGVHQPHLAATGLRYQKLLQWGKERKLVDIPEEPAPPVSSTKKEKGDEKEKIAPENTPQVLTASQKRKQASRDSLLTEPTPKQAKKERPSTSKGKGRKVLSHKSRGQKHVGKLVRVTQVLRGKLFPEANHRVSDIDVLKRAVKVIDSIPEKDERIRELEEKLAQLEKQSKVKRR